MKQCWPSNIASINHHFSDTNGYDVHHVSSPPQPKSHFTNNINFDYKSTLVNITTAIKQMKCCILPIVTNQGPCKLICNDSGHPSSLHSLATSFPQSQNMNSTHQPITSYIVNGHAPTKSPINMTISNSFSAMTPLILPFLM